MTRLGMGLLWGLLALPGLLEAQTPRRKPTVGVYLPSTIADGAGRFEFGEAFARALGEKLGQPWAARSFGRFEDFAAAVNRGALDLAVVDGWVVAQAGLKLEPVATAVRAQEAGGRWAIVSRHKGLVKDLEGKRLAVVRVPKDGEQRFLSHAILGGELNVKRHFVLVPVPDVDSALKALEARSADAALLPLALVPKELSVAYRTARLPGAVVAHIKGHEGAARSLLSSLPGVAPFEKFQPTPGDEVETLRQLLVHGPPRRQCVMAESPLVRVDPAALLRFGEVSHALPSFTSFMEAPTEQPDD